MLKSMTGFGVADGADEKFNLHIEIRAVNSRFLDLSFRIPRGMYVYEEKITSRIKEVVSRGKVEVFISLQDLRENMANLRVDMALAKAYQSALNKIANELGLPKNESAVQIAAYPGVLNPEESDLEELEPLLIETLNASLEGLDSMRLREGARIEEDFLFRVNELESMVTAAESLGEEIVANHRERMRALMAEILKDAEADENRLLQEAAIFADRVNYTEEVVRLKSHFTEFKNMLKEENPVGRKLDFLIQEMNREANTIGSKCNNKEAARLVVDMKAEIEKLREQTQNIE